MRRCLKRGAESLGCAKFSHTLMSLHLLSALFEKIAFRRIDILIMFL